MKINFLFLLLPALFIFLLVTGCSSYELTKYSHNSSCSTTIEGNYYKDIESSYSYPAIFVKMTKYPKLVRGKLISIDDKGVIFDPDNIGFSNQPETFFSYDTLFGVIDNSGKLVYGDIPDFFALKHKMIIGLTESKTQQYVELILEPNEPFAYCLNPGNYSISSIQFISSKKVQDIGYDLPNIHLIIEEGKVNYFGNIYVDYKVKTDENIIVIPCTRNNTERSAALGMFGLVGALANVVASEIESDGLHHIINIERDDNFLPEANKPIIDIMIDVSE